MKSLVMILGLLLIGCLGNESKFSDEEIVCSIVNDDRGQITSSGYGTQGWQYKVRFSSDIANETIVKEFELKHCD